MLSPGVTLIKPYYQDKWVTIYHGDCREILPELPKVDLVLTDPPYGYGHSISDIPVSLETYKLLLTLSKCLVVFGYPEDLINICIELQKPPDEWIAWWAINKRSRHSKNKLPRDQECIAIWGDTNGANQLKVPRLSDAWLKRLWERRGASRDALLGDVWTYSAPGMAFNSFQRLHPNEKPPEVINNLITLCSELNDLVLDPFLGSGTTTHCAKKLNRKCIGIEIEEKYCEIAANRCRQMVMDLNLRTQLDITAYQERQMEGYQERLWDETITQ